MILTFCNRRDETVCRQWRLCGKKSWNACCCCLHWCFIIFCNHSRMFVCFETWNHRIRSCKRCREDQWLFICRSFQRPKEVMVFSTSRRVKFRYSTLTSRTICWLGIFSASVSELSSIVKLKGSIGRYCNVAFRSLVESRKSPNFSFKPSTVKLKISSWSIVYKIIRFWHSYNFNILRYNLYNFPKILIFQKKNFKVTFLYFKFSLN